MARRGEWLRRAVILLTFLLACFLVWQKLAVNHRTAMSILPPALAIVLILWAVFDWIRGARPPDARS